MEGDTEKDGDWLNLNDEAAIAKSYVVNLDTVANSFMRAPGESIGTFALESAIDELAHELEIDPVELRKINEPEKDPTKGTEFSSRDLIEAYRRVYYGSPASTKADPSVVALAELLVEVGRQFDDPKVLKSAIGQYEFLRREYPGSRYRFDALFTIGEIYKDDVESWSVAALRGCASAHPARAGARRPLGSLRPAEAAPKA